MNRIDQKNLNKMQRKHRIRATVSGNTERPRLTVNISNLHVSAQIIDDSLGETLVAATSVGNGKLSGNLTEKAKFVGTEIAKKAKTRKISQVVFDRNGKLYHGRVKALAEAARQEGLRF